MKYEKNAYNLQIILELSIICLLFYGMILFGEYHILIVRIWEIEKYLLAIMDLMKE